MGVGKVSPEGKHRRIDILCIPYEQWGAALLYFTGNDIVSSSVFVELTHSSTGAFASTHARRATPSTSAACSVASSVTDRETSSQRVCS